MSAAAVTPSSSPLALHFPPERYNVNLIDLRKVAEILQPARFRENLEFANCEFTLENRDNGTRTQVEIDNFWRTNRYIERLRVRILVTTLDCPPLGTGQDKPHQVLVSMDFYDIERVEYDGSESQPHVRFWLGRAPGQNGRFVSVFRTGLVSANVN